MNNITKGHYGESLALAHYKSRGFEEVERNWRLEKFEIDLIVRNAENIVFVEVKLRNPKTAVRPVLAVNRGKRKRIFQAANQYIQDHPTTLEPRFDIVEIWDTKPEPSLEHWENAFQP
jgi:putative endonuclease